MKHRLVVANLFTIQLTVLKKDGGIRGRYEVAMKFEKKKNQCHV